MIEQERHSLVGLILAVAVGVVLGGIVLSALFWVIGAVLHLVFWLARIGLIVALAAGFWWLVSRRRARRSWS